MLRLTVIVCLVAAAVGSDPKCETGIEDADKQVCCAKSCGKCGGEDCQAHPGGKAECCAGQIRASGASCATHDPPCMLPVPPAPPIPPPSPETRMKRGYVADGALSCDTPHLLNTSGWFYAYNLNDPFRAAGLHGDCGAMNATGDIDAKFSPMNWCLSGLKAPVPPYVNKTFFMGFNEPNNLHNCNTDAEKVAVAWKEVMEKWPSSQLVSPATAGDGIAWYDQFFGNCSKLYGSGGCKIDYIATHDYSCHGPTTLAYLKQLNERYNKKIWLTEFSCGDHANGRPMEDHARYMTEVLPLLDAAPYVFRYSWMSLHDKSGLRGLVTNDASGKPTLTKLGQIYQSGLP